MEQRTEMEQKEKKREKSPYFACPVCGQRLERGEKVCRCPGGHSFDRAAEGYVHLLPSNRMHSRIPGDTREMVAARRRFLESGGYGRFSEALNQLVREAFSPARMRRFGPEGGGEKVCLLDVGCGEGYYTSRMAAVLDELPVQEQPPVLGFDISKFAVKAAAKKYGKQVEFAVGSTFHIPAEAGVSFCTVNVFAPVVPEELRRVTAPGGWMILAVPSQRHLFGLKEILYDAPYENEKRDTEYPGFRFLERRPVRGELLLEEPGLIQDLFSMTPYYWKTPAEGGERLRKRTFLRTEIGFDFLLYERLEEA